MNNPDNVAIIILNWNSFEDTDQCLKSLELLEYKSFNIFLVDNDSIDNSFEKLIRYYEQGKYNIPISFLQTGSNLGFAGGNNLAIKKAYELGYKYIWLLNNDTEVNPMTLTYLVNEFKQNKTIGMVGSKIYYHNTNIIWFAGGLINKFTGTAKHIGINQIDNGQYDEPQISENKIQYITGCSLCFKREILETVGYMNEDYFLYYEETDWNIRAQQQGWEIKTCPKSLVWHKVSSSSGGNANISPYVQYYFLRNSNMMVKKNLNLFYRVTTLGYTMIKSVKEILKIFIKNQDRKTQRLFYIYRGWKAIFLNEIGIHPKYKDK